jgi:hypothetical protein
LEAITCNDGWFVAKIGLNTIKDNIAFTLLKPGKIGFRLGCELNIKHARYPATTNPKTNSIPYALREGLSGLAQDCKIATPPADSALARAAAFRYSSAMRLLITGINGFVGGHLAEHLLESTTEELWGLAREPALALPALHGRVQPVVADLCQLDQVTAALASVQPDIIVHLAGQSNVARAFADPAQTLQTNILAQLHLFQAALRLKLEQAIRAYTRREPAFREQLRTALACSSQAPLHTPDAQMIVAAVHAAWQLGTRRCAPSSTSINTLATQAI